MDTTGNGDAALVLFIGAMVLLTCLPGPAAADGVFPGVTSSDDYIYTTKDLAVDLVSPLVAYKVVSTAMNQKLNPALDASIALATAAAIYAVVTDASGLDAYLQ